MPENLQTRAEAPPVPYLFLKDPDQRDVIARRAIDMMHAAKDCQEVIFLDQSARPLATLFGDLWGHYYPDRTKPQIRFLNIGSEKVKAVDVYMEERINSGSSSLPERLNYDYEARREYFLQHATEEEVEQIFGLENIQHLMKMLDGNGNEHRLIVDEAKYTGISIRLAQKICSVVDKKNQYSPFHLLESSVDKAPFLTIIMHAPAFPWQIPDKHVLVTESKNRLSFATVPDTDPFSRQRGVQVRKELQRLAGEIKSGVQ